MTYMNTASTGYFGSTETNIKLDEDSLKDDIKQKNELNDLKDINLNDVQEKQRIDRTKLVNQFLKITEKSYIESKVVEAIAKNNSMFRLYVEIVPDNNDLWRKLPKLDRDDIVYKPLCDQDLVFTLIDEHYDLNKSIIEMIADIVPDDYRVSGMYGGIVSNQHGLWQGRRYEITVRRGAKGPSLTGSTCCNDPWCLFLCFYRPLFYYCCVKDYEESDPCVSRCCCSARCCCGP